MTHYELTLYQEEIEPGAALPADASGPVVVRYIVSGALRSIGAAASTALSANSALYLREPAQLKAGSAPAKVLRWELAGAGAAAPPADAAGVRTSILLKAPMALAPDRRYLVRCDRVDFPPGGVAFLHTHQGGGIRCLIAGSIEIETQGAKHGYGPLQAWYEAGPDPVFAAASAGEPTAFVRLMILPRELEGKSSIAYVNAADQEKPKSQRYQVFIDAPCELPGGY